MDCFYIITNKLKDPDYAVTNQIRSYIEKNGRKALLSQKDETGHIVPGTVPEEADCVMIYEPSSDLSEEEAALLAEYTKNGGRLLVIAGPTEDGVLENLYSLLAEYGVETYDGIAVEGDREHYTVQPYILLPDMQSSVITDPLIEERYYPNMPISQAMFVGPESDGVSVTELLTTSGASFSKAAGYDLDTYEKEDGEVDGPFAVALSVDCGNEGQIVW